MKTDNIEIIFPEMEWIADAQLKESCLKTWVAAADLGQWDKDTLCRLPFVIKELKGCPVTLVEHVRNVTRLAVGIQEQFSIAYKEYVAVERDVVIAGALLHDVGKLIEYSCTAGSYVYSEQGQFLRHPLAGAMLAERCGVPAKVVHIIATHSFEGDRSFRTPEAFIVRNADWLNFDFLSFRFPSQMNHK